jgi:PKD repeat protein
VTASTSVTTTTTGLVNDIVLYRWDFGDGTPIQTTSTPSAVHGYTNDTYTAYVEAQDAFGHKAVAHVTVQAGIRLYLPLVAK